MNVVVIQGTSLSPMKAHWVQILNTSWAMAKAGWGEVWVVPRTYEPDMPDRILSEMNLQHLDNLHFMPSVSHATYKRLKLRGDMLTYSQKKIGRFLARRSVSKLLKDVVASNPEFCVLTRNQDVPVVCEDLFAPYKPVLLNEHHKFEYAKDVEGKLQKKRPGRRTLSQFKEFARQERIGEIERLRTFDGVICTTGSIRERLIEFGFDRPVTVIPNGANLSWSDQSVSQKDIDILYVGQLYRWKNVDLLIEALQQLPYCRLTIVGGDRDEDFERLRSLAKKMDVDGRLEFAGHKPHGDVLNYMQRARVGVVPLPRKGFAEARMFCCPLKAIEMMAAGTPIVATRLRSVSDILKHGENSILVEPDNVGALAEGIRRVLNSPDLATKIVEGGRLTAKELSYTSRAEKICNFAKQCRLNSHA